MLRLGPHVARYVHRSRRRDVLFPLTLRDTVLRAAAAGLYHLRWSAEILDEMERNLVSNLFDLNQPAFIEMLPGTGFREDLDEVFGKLEATLRRKDFAAVRNLDRKVFDVNEARHLYEGRLDDVNDIMTALLREDRLRVTHEGVSGGRKTFVLEPYTLLVYKKGLYLSGRSLGHGGEIRTFALDGFREVEWLRGDRFEYPVDYRPEQITEGAFGLIRGKETTQVLIWFERAVARYVQRRMWHPTQRFRNTGDGVEMTMEVRGTVELA